MTITEVKGAKDNTILDEIAQQKQLTWYGSIERMDHMRLQKCILS